MTQAKIGNERLQAWVDEGAIIIGVDVDTQSDFVDEQGTLYVPAGPEVRNNLARLAQNLARKVGSVDSHAYDSPEFKENGGPFNRHCVKGEPGWMRIPETRLDADGKPYDTRYIPMSAGPLVVGEQEFGEGPRAYGAEDFAREVLAGIQAIVEKEVHAAWDNPLMDEYIDKLVELAGGTRKVVFAVYGYCTGDYCADQCAEGFADRGYQTIIVEDATAPLNVNHTGEEQDGAAITRAMAAAKGIEMVTTDQVMAMIQQKPKTGFFKNFRR